MPARSFSVNWSHLERLSAVDEVNRFVLLLFLNNVASLATLTAALARATASAAAATTTASSLVRSVSEAKASKYFAYKYKEVIKWTSNYNSYSYQILRIIFVCGNNSHYSDTNN
jgi:hypothetical protein